VSWAAHQFEIYAVENHAPKKIAGQLSFFAIWLGDFTPDFLAKFWVYGITINGHHYGASKPYQWHRGWPGMGFSHTLFFGALVSAFIWWRTKNPAWTAGYMLGIGAHVITDINDSIGTMLVFPFLTRNWSIGTWAYAATVKGGKYYDAAAYYSSLGFVMDAFWLVVVLFSWRCLTRNYWRTRIVPADARAWAWFSRWLSDSGLYALYLATFFYGLARLVSWTTWAHLIAHPTITLPNGKVVTFHHGYPWDLSWGGPWWVKAVHLPAAPRWLVLPVALLLLFLLFRVVLALWDPMQRVAMARRL
jgi:hypothetical protein